MTAPRPGYRRHRPPAGLAVPPELATPPARVRIPRHMRAPEAPANRARISADVLRYAWDVHQADEHAGQLGRGCHVCVRYSGGLTRARTIERAHGDAFEVPTSAANAYAALIRPTIGGLTSTTAPPAAEPTP